MTTTSRAVCDNRISMFDTTEQVAALRDHLGDMRALVFKNYLKPKGAAP